MHYGNALMQRLTPMLTRGRGTMCVEWVLSDILFTKMLKFEDFKTSVFQCHLLN